ncbi:MULTISPECIES: c-type cytochrome [Silvimonas]|uniref:c-type cytochrome n=1 Tax=Silvimonas TaxID=300264 RepID=UPI0024B3BBD8|nr:MULTISPECIES: c-type cytochrome [Silvimonas]MDR3429255.1 c-type cytochrome [Silvimonas sp.]
MSGSNASGVKSFVGLIVAALVGVPLFIFMVVKLFTSGSGVNLGLMTMTDQAIESRLQPVGISKVVDSAPIGSRSGKMVFENVCISCHGTGLMGSPKFGDSAAWAPRISKGFETLWTHAIHGFNAMPARGGSTDLTDDEVKRAVAYMADDAGAKFVAPEPAGGAGGAIDPEVKGKEIFESTCSACHGTGLLGSPKFGDKAAWTAKLGGNADAAIEKVLKSGNGQMPVKGGYTGSDDEFRAAAHYMINHAK